MYSMYRVKSLSFMSNQFGDFNKKLESTLTEIKHLRNENVKMKTKKQVSGCHSAVR